jgi:hypothetical protein
MRALRENVGERCHTSFIYFAIDWEPVRELVWRRLRWRCDAPGALAYSDLRNGKRSGERLCNVRGGCRITVGDLHALPEHRLRRDVAYVAPVLSLSAPLLFFLLEAGPLDNFIPRRHFAP